MKVSIIIPVYNVEKYIRRCVESLINQTHCDLEIIFVNDKTPDNSMQIVQEYANKDNRIQILNNPRNMGQMMSRENGYKIATGNYIMFVDSDDYLPLNAVAILLTKALTTDADIVSGNYLNKKLNGKEILTSHGLPYGTDSESVYRALLKNFFVHSLWGKIYKSNIIKDYKYENMEGLTNGEDACLLYQIVENVSHVETVDEPVYYYVENPASSMNRKFTLKQVDNIILSNSIRDQIRMRHISLNIDFSNHIGISLLWLYTHDLDRKEISLRIKNAGLGKYIIPVNICRTLFSMSLTDMLRYIKNYTLQFFKKI